MYERFLTGLRQYNPYLKVIGLTATPYRMDSGFLIEGEHRVFTDIAYEVSNRVATITLDRPDRLNAFTGRMMYELIEAFDLADADDDVRAVVVTGRGRGFCAGIRNQRGCPITCVPYPETA